MKNFRVWFSSRQFGGLAAAAALAVSLAPQASAQQFNGTFRSPNATVNGTFNGPAQTFNFSANGPTAVLNMPAVPVSNFDPVLFAQQQAYMAQQQAAAQMAATNSLGTTGEQAYGSYKTGEAPSVGSMSGNYTTSHVNPHLDPSQGMGNNAGLDNMTNGLMAPFSTNPQAIPLFDGLTYGFPQAQRKVYDMSTGPQRLLNGLINGLGGGYVTTGPILPTTGTGSVNLNTTMGNGY